MLSLIPAIVLLVVAIYQRLRVRSVHQSAWKGGGFGMFSDIHRNSIAAVIWARANDGQSEPLTIDPSPLFSKPSIVPTARNIQSWGRELVRAKWQRCGRRAHAFMPYGDGVPLAVLKVTLSHLRIDFDARSGTYTTSGVQTHTVHAGPVTTTMGNPATQQR